MAKKSLKKATKQLAPEKEARQSGKAYPAAPEELNGQQRRPKKAATAGVEALQSTAPAAMSSRPLAPLSTAWPAPAPAQAASKSVQAPARQAQTRPVRVTAPQTSPAPAAPVGAHPVEWEPTQSLAKAAAAAEAAKPPTPPRVKVTFVLPLCNAKRVSLSGEFNGWSPDATPMKRHDDGHWETTVELSPGRYEYKFVRDGEWIPDLLAHENIWNQHGTLNSVVEVRP